MGGGVISKLTIFAVGIMGKPFYIRFPGGESGWHEYLLFIQPALEYCWKQCFVYLCAAKQMNTEEYITLHRHEDPSALALKGAPQGVDMPFALRQIEGWQTARKKLPRWAAAEGIVYPVRLSMQQCSSQQAAEYKASLVQSLLPPAGRDSMADLTGGLGVDFSFIAPLFRRATYVERNAELCAAAEHNMPLLGLPQATIVNGDAGAALAEPLSFIYLDPARRDMAGRKVVCIEDCSPDVAALQGRLLATAPVVMIKLSPMLDISQALRTLRCVEQVHVVAADGECKELLMVLRRDFTGEATIHCEGLVFTRREESDARPQWAEDIERYLYIPSAAMMKAAPYRLLSLHYGIKALPPDTHLYTSQEALTAFPGRTMVVEEVCDIKTFRRSHPEVTAANIIVRGYPDTPEALRKRLKLKDGGSHYLVATTLSSARRVLLLCRMAV